MSETVFSPTGDISADVVIVGSGVVGAAIAQKMREAGLSVAIFEAGLRLKRGDLTEGWRNIAFHNRIGSDFQGFYKQAKHAPAPLYFPPNDYVQLNGPDGSAYTQGYLRTVGGTTWHWAASCWRHLPVDMAMKSTYGVGRDWPISYNDLEPYYCDAEELMGVSGPHDKGLQSPPERSRPYPRDMIPYSYLDQRFADTVNPHGFKLVPIPQGRSIQPFGDRPACCGNNNCQPICPIGAMFNGIQLIEKVEAAGATVIEQAVVYKAETDSANRITALHWYDRNGASFRAAAKAFVFACNGIETPRLLLLAANDKNPKGLANSSDQVGRNMMDHSGLHATITTTEPFWVGRGPAQNSAMVGPRDGAFRSQYSASKIIVANINRTPQATQQALALGLVGQELDDEIRRRAACSVDLSISLEPLPSPDNRLTLSPTRKDPLGLACPDIYYDVGDYVRQGAKIVTQQIHQIGQLFNAVETTVTEKFNANNHIMGGCIMGTSAKDGVVDGNCKTFDHPNLWLPGGGAMPSASVVNTTLSMVALALRAADAIKADIASGRI